MVFARHNFEVSQPLDDGQPLLAHLNAAWNQTGEQPEMLANAPKCPRGCETLWADFLDLHSQRGGTGFGAARISARDIADWQELSAVRLEHWEVAAIRKLDTMWMNEFADRKPEA